MSQVYVPGTGPRFAKLFIVGIAPGAEEVKRSLPFVGPSGNLLSQDLREAGVDIKETYRSNVFKYQLPDNEFKKYKEIGLSLEDAMVDLNQEINDIKPNCILGLGDPVLYSLMHYSGSNNGINVWRGSILNYNGIKTIFTWHPAHELHSEAEAKTWKYWQKYVRKFDIKRAVEQSLFKEFDLPQRLLHVARSSSDVRLFIERYRNEEYCSVDIEAIEGIPICIGLSFVPYEGISIPLWGTVKIQCKNDIHPKKSYNYNLKVSEIPTSDLVYIWSFLSELFLNERIKFIGQNFKYDEDKINRLGFYLHNLYWDTMIGSHCISPEMPKSLAFQTSVNTLEPYYKYEGRNFVLGKDKIDQFFLYNAKDACVTREIFDRQIEDLNQIPFGISHATWRMQLHRAYLKIDNTGFAIDENERKNLIIKYVDWLVKLETELKELTKEDINIASPIQVSDLLYNKLKIPQRAGTGEEVLTSLLGNVIKDEKQKRVCEIILDHRRVNKSIGLLKAESDYDGRMKTTFLITGTENYRTSTNILEPPIRPEKMGWAFQTISKHGDIGQDLRSILIADPGYIIVNIDQSQAEARVCSLLADDEETLKSYDTIDKHALTASKFFGGAADQYSKKRLGYECPERFVGKAQPLTSKILTPVGWKLMGDIKIGDVICNTYGSTSLVTGVYPQGLKTVYEVEFSDGSKTTSCANHYWPVRSPTGAWKDSPYKVIQLKYLMNNLQNIEGEYTKIIPTTNPVFFERKTFLPLSPYNLGLLLGDGSFRGKYNYSFSTTDDELLLSLENEIGKKLTPQDKISYYIPADFCYKIKYLSLHGTYSYNKFIPEIYKFSSKEERLELLRGLMDTDGTLNNLGTGVTFDTTSKQLAEDVIFLVNSLGGVATYSNRMPIFSYKGIEKTGKLDHRVFIRNLKDNPFKLKRKASKWKATTSYRRIVKISPVYVDECQCISVDSKDSNYITDDFIVTHNTMRHAYHLDIGKHEAMVNVNTDARKYKIPIRISEWRAAECLRILEQDTPKIKSVFHHLIQELLHKNRRIVGTFGASRYFYDPSNSRDLFKGAYSFIPQQTVTDKTKSVILKVYDNIWDVKIVVESHDSLTFLIREKVVDERIEEIQSYFAEPIDFSNCSIPRRSLIIPTEVEIGYNYKDLRRYVK